MDGDNGRLLRKPNRPLTTTARAENAKLRGFPITFIVLERYAIENYFTQSAMEAVIGQDLTRFFPIPHDVPVQTHFATTKKSIMWRIRNFVAGIFRLAPPMMPSLYSKSRNREVAGRLYPDDIKETDLYTALETIVQIGRRLQGES
jgi:hypothetical protein